MLEVIFYRDSQDRLSSVFARGHAEFAEHGEDIVCAAVSAILQALRLGLEAYADIPLDAQQESGEMVLRWPEGARDDASVKAIVATAELSVERIANQYPEHVKFSRELDRRGTPRGISWYGS
ncbi:MAG: ribosomal-processing cysteine protease Prp [Candidatus Eremiobacteraeota bacterium]|nr:ribosomal-processing cysteine protease Prp [Candidatus Eremiobacteraeota bacterium]